MYIYPPRSVLQDEAGGRGGSQESLRCVISASNIRHLLSEVFNNITQYTSLYQKMSEMKQV